MAFSENQVSFIRDYAVDGEYDKVLINSETNILSFYQTTETRAKSPTSYALAMGVYSTTGDIYGNCFYWTKGSGTDSYKAVAMTANGTSTSRDVWYTNTGVLPSISINIGGFTNA